MTYMLNVFVGVVLIDQYIFGSYKLCNHCPNPDRECSMNFFLAKQVHHLLGLPSGVLNTFSIKRFPVSWRIWVKYWRSRSKRKTKIENVGKRFQNVFFHWNEYFQFMENDRFNSKIFCSEAESGKKKWAIKKVSEKNV